jgi:exonuclease SbcC
MKIQNLKISGFLSYQKEVEIDFTQFSLACITGSNGAGKSSILDAITFALFGRARQRDESLINLQSDTAAVTLSFVYANENYTVCRSNQRGKAARLTLKTPELDLTERTARDTQDKIESILKIDYETFIHAVFFLQGESDQFVTASPGQRKQVLFDILGLDAWEDYRLKAAAEIKGIEKQMEQSRGSVQVLEEDIRGEDGLRNELVTASVEVENTNGDIVSATLALDAEQKIFDEFISWKEGQEELRESFAGAAERVTDLTNRRTLLLDQQAENTALTSRKPQIIKDYARSQELSRLLGDYGTKEIEHGKLQHTLSGQEAKLQEIEDDLLEIPEHEKNISSWLNYIADAEKYELQVNKIKENQIKWNAEGVQKAAEKHDLSAQIEGLEGHSECPLCKQALKNPEELINLLKEERNTLAKQEQQLWEEIENGGDAIDAIQGKFESVNEYRDKLAGAQQLIESIQKAHEEFDLNELRSIEDKIKLLDYDPVKGDELRAESTALRNAGRDHGLLESAEKIGDSLTVQIQGLDQDLFDAEATVLEYQNQLESKKDKYTEGYEQEHGRALQLFKDNLENARAAYDLEVKKEGQIEAQLQNIEKQKERLKEIRANEKENTELHQTNLDLTL